MPLNKQEDSMNILKQIFAVTAIVAVFALIACGGDDGGNDPCDCNPKAHLGIGETCNCGGSGCNCTEQTATVGGIPIRKVAGITVEQMKDAVEIIDDAYNTHLSSIEKVLVQETITEIQIVSGDKVIKNGTVLKIGTAVSQEIVTFYFTIIDTDF
jgi:hypothetical protein